MCLKYCVGRYVQKFEGGAFALGYCFGGSEVAELTVPDLRPLQLGFTWHPAFPSWVLSDRVGFTRPLVAPLCLP